MKLSKTQNFIAETKTEFQQYQDEQITDSQATEIQNNMFGVIDLLLKWSSAFIQEGQKILQRLRQLIGAKNRQADLDLMLNNEEETDEQKMRQRFPFLK